MSRVGSLPVELPEGCQIVIDGACISVTGAKGSGELNLHGSTAVEQDGKVLKIVPTGKQQSFYKAMSGTMRALLNNLIVGHSVGFDRRLNLVGVGYSGSIEGKKLKLLLGFSHPIEYAVPEGVKVEMPSSTEIVLSGTDKQKVGQAAAQIRAFRPPEPYKGKGVRYSDEVVLRKESKKK